MLPIRVPNIGLAGPVGVFEHDVGDECEAGGPPAIDGLILEWDEGPRLSTEMVNIDPADLSRTRRHHAPL